jgi:radical SAM protein
LDECANVLEDLSRFDRKPLIVLTGGDPVQRPDLFDIINEAKRRGFTIAITPSATPVTTRGVIRRLKESGVERVAISLDGADAETHDGFRRVSGSFDISMNIVNWAREFDLPVQINTTIARHNLEQFDRIGSLVGDLRAVLWSVFFLVPTGRANDEMQISQVEAENVLRGMAKMAESGALDVKATAGPFFRRALIQAHAAQENAGEAGIMRYNDNLKLGALRSYQSVNDGKGILFISHVGEVYPSGFLPIAAGNVRSDSIVDVYRNSELFQALRDPNRLQGKCGTCRFKAVCGGSRARAYAATGDYLAEDPLCLYRESESFSNAG